MTKFTRGASREGGGKKKKDEGYQGLIKARLAAASANRRRPLTPEKEGRKS